MILLSGNRNNVYPLLLTRAAFRLSLSIALGKECQNVPSASMTRCDNTTKSHMKLPMCFWVSYVTPRSIRMLSTAISMLVDFRLRLAHSCEQYRREVL